MDFSELREFFDRDGFVIVRDFWSPEQIEHVQSAFKKIVAAFVEQAAAAHDVTATSLPSIGSSPCDGLMFLEDIDHSYVAQVYDTFACCPDMFSLVGNPDLTQLVNRLHGDEPRAPLYTYTPRLRIDPPQDDRRTYGWHQEVFYTLPHSVPIQLWAPLFFPSTAENGAIEVCPVSHARGIFPSTWEEPDGRATQIIVKDDEIDKYDPLLCELSVGDLVLFSGFLLHRSGSNTSSQIRYSMICMYHRIRNLQFRPASIGSGFGYHDVTPKDYFREVLGESSFVSPAAS